MPPIQDLQRSVEEMSGRATVEGRSADGKVLAMIAAELSQVAKLTDEVAELDAACSAYETTVSTLRAALLSKGHSPAALFDDQGHLQLQPMTAALVDLTTASTSPWPKG